MSSLIASQVAVGRAQRAFLHSCLGINYCRSLNTRLTAWPSSLNLSRRAATPWHQISKTKISRRNLDPVSEDENEERTKGTIWSSKSRASKFSIWLICWKIRKHGSVWRGWIIRGKWFRRFGEWYHCSFIILTRTDASDIDLHRKLDC